jgi:hypothetical protein
MLLIAAPPGHEKYFDELRDLVAKGGKSDPDGSLSCAQSTTQSSSLH